MSEGKLMVEKEKAYKEYETAKKNHVELQKTFLEELAEPWESVGKGGKASNIKCIMDRERLVDQFQKLKAVMKKII